MGGPEGLAIISIMLLEIALPVAVLAGGLWVFAKTPFGKAILQRLRGGQHDGELLRELANEVDALRAEMGEVQERLDFAERQVIAGSTPTPHPPGPSR